VREERTYGHSGGKIMVRYFYAWTPLTIVAAVVFLALPWLGLIALMVVAFLALGALASLALAIVSALRAATGAVGHSMYARIASRPAPAPMPKTAPVLLVNARSHRDA
jgi:hypothetical protein